MPITPANDPARADERADAPLSPSSRREFLQRGVRALGAGAVTLVLCDLVDLQEAAAASGAATQSGELLATGYDWSKHSYVYLIDTRKCIGCGACVRACSRENDVPAEYFRTWIERYEVSRTGQVVVDSPNGGMDGFEPLVSTHDVTKAFFFPKLCCHCTHSPCVQLCPVGASYRSPDAVVQVDERRCIGCGYCVQGCPYGSRFIHPITHVASKCTLCYHRLVRGLTTACVQACPVGARMLGDAKKAGDKVAEIIATHSVQILQPELLTDPNCFYLGLSKEAR